MAFSEIISLPYIYDRPLPGFQNGDDIKFPDTLAAYLIDRFTKPGEKILDPFTGLGTTFFVSEQLERIPYGVESDKQRYDWVSERIKSKNNLKYGDSGNISTYDFPLMDFLITSPPYMPDWDDWNPLYGGNPKYKGYDTYLTRMQEIFSQIKNLMKEDAYLIVQADNLTHKGFSPLVWDLGKTISQVITLEGELIIHWNENSENTNPFTQCLVFQNR